jgi:hypothetical protein
MTTELGGKAQQVLRFTVRFGSCSVYPPTPPLKITECAPIPVSIVYRGTTKGYFSNMPFVAYGASQVYRQGDDES